MRLPPAVRQFNCQHRRVVGDYGWAQFAAMRRVCIRVDLGAEVDVHVCESSIFRYFQNLLRVMVRIAVVDVNWDLARQQMRKPARALSALRRCHVVILERARIADRVRAQQRAAVVVSRWHVCFGADADVVALTSCCKLRQCTSAKGTSLRVGIFFVVSLLSFHGNALGSAAQPQGRT